MLPKKTRRRGNPSFCSKFLSVCNDMVNMRVEVSDISGYFFRMCSKHFEANPSCPTTLLSKEVANTNTSPIWKITSQIDFDWIHWDLWDCLGDVTVCKSAISSFSGFILGPLTHPTPRKKRPGTLKNMGIFSKSRFRTWNLIHFFQWYWGSDWE